ncbi:hypothetical protein DRO26_02305 [Candidatus Bathyarchaeota archaeon]|nr:MAG: hypothetical protein DRO26_02305 [Candidatus Bathyarchaeota archaeon]
MSLKDIFSLTLPQQKIAVSWFNDYSGVVIKSPNTTIIFDPVNIRPEEISQVNIIVVTHEHYDHFEAELVKEIQKKTNAVIVTTPYVASQLKNVPTASIKQLKIGESITFGEVRLNAERSNHPGNQPLSFMVTMENGLKIYHSSDSRPYPEMKSLGEKYKPDLAFCTVGIAPGASPMSGVEIAKLVKPKVAIPYHTDEPKQLQMFAELLKKEEPTIKVKVLKKLEVYQYPD